MREGDNALTFIPLDGWEENMRWLIIAWIFYLLCCVGYAYSASGPSSLPSPENNRSVALIGAKIYPAPAAKPINDGVVLIKDGRIVGVGERAAINIPADAAMIDCVGLIMTSAFWNSHVHFTEPKWQSADTQPAEQLAENLRTMLTQYGFARVLDTGSRLRNTLTIRKRIERGEVVGPSIMTTCEGFAPKGGSPFYILPNRLPEIGSPAEAEKMVNERLDAGADAVQLFSGSWASMNAIVVMPVDVVSAAVQAARQRGKRVVAHPSNCAGTQAAIDGGVDILAHTFPAEIDGPWDRSLMTQMKEKQVALSPTLKLWTYEAAKFNRGSAYTEKVVGIGGEQVLAFSKVGGQILFGTDVGYMQDYDPTDEYVLMQRAGLSFEQVLTSLTTAPAERFGVSQVTGRIAAGMDADIVLLAGDPTADIKYFANVRYTIRKGNIIYQNK
jgi:imidazolonepropionase-like amidohydrolase